MARILVTGGAGYIGSVCSARLREHQHTVTVVDNLSAGHRQAAPADLVVMDLADEKALDDVFACGRFDGVMHFASHCYVGESVINPQKYFEDNVGNGMKLFAAMLRHGVLRFVLSSTCATYGNPHFVPITEKHPQQPINPYGESKRMLERILAAYDQAYGMKSVFLRYFNACGASLDGKLGESHDPETHLIPLVLRASGDNFELTVFGNDYETPDGTCVRDYVHVEDLAEAHIAAFEKLLSGGETAAYNLGVGHGLSVHEVITAAQKITGRRVKYNIGPRRPGDPAVLVANAELACRELGWTARHSDIETVIKTAWKWFQNPRY
ncbi:MAG TPA: UDP-glucose 4-epimerase GalE [Acidobacteriota bacterium]|jgi:UDP-glucose-4-epimerase GalE